MRTTAPWSLTIDQLTVVGPASRNESAVVGESESPSCGKNTAFDAATQPSDPNVVAWRSSGSLAFPATSVTRSSMS